MAPTTRKPHKKSRHGCQQCKKNRTKCDEAKPRCGRCVRTGAECSLLDPTSALIIINGTPIKSRSVANTENIALPSPPESTTASIASVSDRTFDETFESVSTNKVRSASSPTQLYDDERMRLRLMHRYTRLTCTTISNMTLDTEEGQFIWQASVPDLAFQHEYLLHAILSITALHIALTDRSLQHEYGILAIQHYNQGVALFTPQLERIAPDNIDNLFAFACLTALYSFGIHLKGNSQLSPLAKIHEVFSMIRGTSLIVSIGEPWLQQGIWSAWFLDTTMPNMEVADDIEDMIQMLKSRIGSTISTSSQREMYTMSIELLKENFHQATVVSPRNQCSLVLLPLMAPPEFLPMVCIGEPLALAILANWAVILHWLRGHIWLQNWGAETIKAVYEVLPPDYRPCVAWAMNELKHPQDLTLLTASSSDKPGQSVPASSYRALSNCKQTIDRYTQPQA